MGGNPLSGGGTRQPSPLRSSVTRGDPRGPAGVLRRRSARATRLLLLGAALLGAAAPRAAAGQEPEERDRAQQEVEFTARGGTPEEERLATFLREGIFDLRVRDTVLSPETPIRRSLLVLDASVRLDAPVEGSVYVVAGDLFLRAGARIAGDVVVLGGGFYDSELARVEGDVVYRPDLALRVVPQRGGYEIFLDEDAPAPVSLHGLHGVRMPTYQRVDGLTLGLGATLRPPGIAWSPELDAIVRFRTEQAELEGTVRSSWQPGRSLRFGVEAERATRTRDEWIRGDLSNSASFLIGEGDFRDYYRADRIAVFAEAPDRPGWRPFASIGRERARSLEASPQPLPFSDDAGVRPNPPGAGGVTWSGTAALSHARREGNRRHFVRFGVEGAHSDVAGDFSFLLGDARAAWRRPTVAGHSLELFGITRMDLAGTSPVQRRSAIGGQNTLPLLDVLQRRGEKLLFGQASYYVPVEPLRIPVLGAPAVLARAASGSAWTGGDDLSLTTNLMAGIRFLLVEAVVALDPETGNAEIVVGTISPGRLWR